MRIIKQSFLKAAAEQYPRAAESLAAWFAITRLARWENPVAMKASFPDVDPVKVKSGHTVFVFNIRRNEFRLIVAVHFDAQRVYTLRFFTHAEYDRIKWRKEL
jgi:mRNA interferase HigB